MSVTFCNTINLIFKSCSTYYAYIFEVDYILLIIWIANMIVGIKIF